MSIISSASRSAIRFNVASKHLLIGKNIPSSSVGAKRLFGGYGDDHGDHEHLTFTPPYNKGVIAGLVGFVLIGGSGSMIFGFCHQQYKQGVWK